MLKDGILLYYKSSTDLFHPQGMIPTESAKVERLPEKVKKCAFQVVCPDRTFILAAESGRELEQWLESINDVINGKYKKQANAESDKTAVTVEVLQNYIEKLEVGISQHLEDLMQEEGELERSGLGSFGNNAQKLSAILKNMESSTYTTDYIDRIRKLEANLKQARDVRRLSKVERTASFQAIAQQRQSLAQMQEQAIVNAPEPSIKPSLVIDIRHALNQLKREKADLMASTKNMNAYISEVMHSAENQLLDVISQLSEQLAKATEEKQTQEEQAQEQQQEEQAEEKPQEQQGEEEVKVHRAHRPSVMLSAQNAASQEMMQRLFEAEKVNKSLIDEIKNLKDGEAKLLKSIEELQTHKRLLAREIFTLRKQVGDAK